MATAYPTHPERIRRERRKHDAYYSASWFVRALLEHVPIPLTSTILEPCCGDGAISNALKKHGYQVTTNDINPACDPDMNLDYLTVGVGFLGFDWVVTNPPFNLAYPMLLKSLLDCKIGVAFLLRLSFVEPTYERGDWLEKNPPTGRITLPRYSFTGDGRSDSVTTEWMVWLLDKAVPQFNRIVSRTTVMEWLTQKDKYG